MGCAYCKKEYSGNKDCPDCGHIIYTAEGKLIYGATYKDSCDCEVTLAEKYLIIRRVSGGERTGDAIGRATGLLGVFVAELVTEMKDKEYGFYPVSGIEKAIYPYKTTKIKAKSAFKLINKDGTEFILLFDRAGFDSAGKIREKMADFLGRLLPQIEDGSGRNYGSTYCTNPYVNKDNFDKIPPLAKKTKTRKEKAAPVEKTPEPQVVTSAPEVKKPEPQVVTPAPVVAEPKPAEEKPQVVQNGLACPSCGNHLPADSRFCNLCGTRLEKVCAGCGQKLDDVDRFCRHCGTPAK